MAAWSSKLILAGLIVLVGAGCMPQAPIEYKTATIDDLLGCWEAVDGGDAEEICFSQDEEGFWFDSFLHERPFVSGMWVMRKNGLQIIDESGELLYYYSQAMIEEGFLILERDDGETEQYEKIEE